MTTGKPIGLTIWAFVGKVMSLLISTLSRFEHLLISCMIIVKPHKNGKRVIVKAFQVEQIIKQKKTHGLLCY